MQAMNKKPWYFLHVILFDEKNYVFRIWKHFNILFMQYGGSTNSKMARKFQSDGKILILSSYFYAQKYTRTKNSTKGYLDCKEMIQLAH